MRSLFFAVSILFSFFLFALIPQDVQAQRRFVDNCSSGFKATEKSNKKCECVQEYSYEQRGICNQTGQYQDQVDNQCSPGYVPAITGSVCNCVLSENAGTCSLILTQQEVGTTPAVQKEPSSSGQLPSRVGAQEGAVGFSALNQAIGLKLTKFGGENVDLTLSNVVNVLIPYLFGIAGILLLLYLLWGGFGLMLSRGDPKAVEAAKTRITHAFFGFIIIFVAYWLVRLVGEILGITQFGELFQSN